MLSHIILGQVIFTLLIHIFITLPCVIVLLKYYVDQHYSLVLRVYLYYLGIFSSAAVIYCIYLLIFWSAAGNGYNLQALSLLGSISWSLQFACYNIEFFICFERCLTIILKLHYTKKHKNAIGICAIVAAGGYLATIFIADKLPFWLPSGPTTCQFYGCILDQKPIVVARYMTIANGALNICCAILLIILIRIFLKCQNNNEWHLYKSILISIIATTVFQCLSNVVPTLTYMIFSTPLTSFLGPIWYTIMSVNVAFSAFIYFHAFRSKSNIKRNNIIVPSSVAAPYRISV